MLRRGQAQPNSVGPGSLCGPGVPDRLCAGRGLAQAHPTTCARDHSQSPRGPQLEARAAAQVTSGDPTGARARQLPAADYRPQAQAGPVAHTGAWTWALASQLRSSSWALRQESPLPRCPHSSPPSRSACQGLLGTCDLSPLKPNVRSFPAKRGRRAQVTPTAQGLHGTAKPPHAPSFLPALSPGWGPGPGLGGW